MIQSVRYGHDFTIKNAGDETLEISEVDVTCGCSVADYDATIAPGKTGIVRLEIMDDRISPGRFDKKATIRSNDPKRPSVTIALAGNIIQHVEVEPSDRVYLRGVYGEPASSEVTISSPVKKDGFVVTSVSSNIDDKITYAVEPGNEPGVYTLRMWKNPKLPAMSTWGSVTIASNHEDAPERSLYRSTCRAAAPSLRSPRR